MQNITTLTLLIILALAVLKDMQTHRIPNVLTVTAAVAGLSMQTVMSGLPGLISSIAGLAAGIALLLPFYLLRGMGAGDVKLMGAVGSFLGAKAVVLAAAATLGIGALLGICIVVGQRLSHTRLGPKTALLDGSSSGEESPFSIRKQKFPYAIAIAGGSVVALSQFGQLHSLAGSILGWSS